VNKVLLTGRLTRDPETRQLASGKTLTSFNVATNEYRGQGEERAEYHSVVTWDRLAEVCGQYLAKGSQVAIDGRVQTRQWEDDRGIRHWKTEIVAGHVEMLSGRRKKDYEAETGTEAEVAEVAAAEAAAADAAAADAAEPIPDDAAA